MGKQLTCLPETTDLLDAFDVGIVTGGVVARAVDGVDDGLVRGHLDDPDLFFVICHFSFHKQ